MSTLKLQSHGSDYKQKEVQAPSNIRESNLFLSAAPNNEGVYWPGWDVAKIEFGKPSAGSSADGFKFELIDLPYNYAADGQKPLRGPLEFESHYSLKDGELFDLVAAFSGVTPKKLSPQEEEKHAAAVKAAKKKGKTIEPPKTKYRTIIQLNDQNPVHARLIEIFRQIYVACLKVVTAALGSKYKMPDGPEADICETNDSPYLRYPLMYARTKDTKKDVIPGSQPAIDLSITAGGRDGTKFMGIESVKTNPETGKVEYTVKYYKFEEVLRRGFQHIPRIQVPSIFLGTQQLIRIRCPQTYIYKFTNETTGSMASTLNIFAAAGIATDEDKAAGEVVKDAILAEKKELEARAGVVGTAPLSTTRLMKSKSQPSVRCRF